MKALSKHYVCLWSGIVIGVGGQMLLKAGAGEPTLVAQLLNLKTIVGLGCYVAATVCYMIAIRRIPLSVAFPSISFSYVFVLLLGTLLFGESLSFTKVVAILMIGAGVWVLNR